MTRKTRIKGMSIATLGLAAVFAANGVVVAADDLSYPIVDTGQTSYFDNEAEIDAPAEGEAFYGQDAGYDSTQASYTDNDDGTVTDNVTGLVWAQALSESPTSWDDAAGYCESLSLGDIEDWRVPSLKELWSIRDFSMGWPWVDNEYFGLVGDGSEGSQQHTWSSNDYLVDTEEAAQDLAFAVNDWTGHIKAFDGNRWVRCVSGNEDYGTNDFVDNADGTVSDAATGLMWSVADSGEAMDWESAFAYAQELNEEAYLGYDDWRVPDVKEAQSIVDYSGVLPAIDSELFEVTGITNEAGNADHPYYWTSTSVNSYFAWYVASGYAVDPDGNDTHGAGAVRFDTKAEDSAAPEDAERIYNYVRVVRTEVENDFEPPEGAGNTGNATNAVWANSGPGGGAGGPGEGGPDMGAAAEALGVSEQELRDALGEGRPDFEAAAEALGLTVEELQEALGGGQGGPPPDHE